MKTYEKQHEPINPETSKGENKIIEFLWDSDINRNKITLNSIGTGGQDEPGIVTKDGVIVDGNRRCMIIKKLQNMKETYPGAPNYFKAVILEDTLQDNAKEIRRLETIYQMGVDEKVDYGAIEKYLKCKEMTEVDGYTPKQISEMIADTKESDVKIYLSILSLMEDYLDSLGYGGMYTLLREHKVEGPFVDLNNYLNKHSEGKNLHDRSWEPKKKDIANLKQIYFDYIRAGFRTAHNIRNIGNPSKRQGFFNNENIWNDFLDRYKEIDEINLKEKSLCDWRTERPNEEIEDIIKARETSWKQEVGMPNSSPSKLKKNLEQTKRQLEDQNEENSPFELLTRAKNTLNSVNTEVKTFKGEDIKKISHEIRKMAENFIKIVDNKAKNK